MIFTAKTKFITFIDMERVLALLKESYLTTSSRSNGVNNVLLNLITRSGTREMETQHSLLMYAVKPAISYDGIWITAPQSKMNEFIKDRWWIGGWGPWYRRGTRSYDYSIIPFSLYKIFTETNSFIRFKGLSRKEVRYFFLRHYIYGTSYIKGFRASIFPKETVLIKKAGSDFSGTTPPKDFSFNPLKR